MAMEISMGRTSLWGWLWGVDDNRDGHRDGHGKDMSVGMAMRRRWPWGGCVHKVDMAMGRT